MSRREITTPLTQAEVSVLEAEKRTENARAEFELICNDKKRVFLETEGLNKKIEDSEIILKKNNSEIEDAKRNLAAANDSYMAENNKLNKIIEERKLAEKGFEEFKKSSEMERVNILAAIDALRESHLNEKNNSLKELKNIEIERESILNTIKSKNASLDALHKDEEKTKKRVSDLEVACENILGRIEIAASNLEEVATEVLAQENSCTDAEIATQKANQVLAEKIKESEKIDAAISEKNKEYRELESKIFTITKREDLLKQKEGFIKAQFERAGIKWEE